MPRGRGRGGGATGVGQGQSGGSMKNKRALIQRVISKMQQAVRARIIKFLQKTFSASSQAAFAVAKAYLRGLKFEQLKQVYYSDLDVQAVASLFQQMNRKSQKPRKTGLPPIHSPQRHAMGQTQPQIRPQPQQQRQRQEQQRQQQPSQTLQRADRLPNIHAGRGQQRQVNNAAAAVPSTARKAPGNVWAAIMTYDVEMKRKEDQAKAQAKRRELRECVLPANDCTDANDLSNGRTLGVSLCAFDFLLTDTFFCFRPVHVGVLWRAGMNAFW